MGFRFLRLYWYCLLLFIVPLDKKRRLFILDLPLNYDIRYDVCDSYNIKSIKTKLEDIWTI